MKGFQTLPVNTAYILFEINPKDDYKSHITVKSLSAAKKIKKAMKAVWQLPGDSVFINKLVGFHADDYIHCTNGYKYAINELDKWESNALSTSDEVLKDYVQEYCGN